MEVTVIDGAGGRIGKEVIERIRAAFPDCDITAVGTNSTASSAMLRGGADRAATGENAVKVCARRAKIIVCPIGAVIADSLLGEISPAMAEAIGASDAIKLLIPVNLCRNVVIGVPDTSLKNLLDGVTEKLRELHQK